MRCDGICGIALAPRCPEYVMCFGGAFFCWYGICALAVSATVKLPMQIKTLRFIRSPIFNFLNQTPVIGASCTSPKLRLRDRGLGPSDCVGDLKPPLQLNPWEQMQGLARNCPRMICFRCERDSWNAPGRQGKLCQHALESCCAVSPNGRTRGQQPAGLRDGRAM